MANSHSALAPVNFMPMVQRYVNKKLVAKMVARTRFPGGMLRSGQSIDWPYTTDMRTQAYTPGTDLTIDSNTATSDTLSLNVSRAATFTLDPNQQKQAEDKGMQAKMANQAAHQIASDIDQRVFTTAINGANNTQAAGTLNSGNIYSALGTAMATLHRNNLDMEPFVVIDPERANLLAQSQIGNTFNGADAAWKNGFISDSVAGFRVYRSNNLPTSNTITLATNPTANDTVVIAGVTFTFVSTIGTTAGNVLIGGSAAATQTNLRTLFNDPSTTTANGVALSVADQRKLQTGGFSMGAFSSDVATITGYGKQGNTETLTASADGFGTETGSLLAGGVGSVALAMQIEPTMASAPLPNRPMETNYAIHTLFGTKVFHRDANLLVNMTINV